MNMDFVSKVNDLFIYFLALSLNLTQAKKQANGLHNVNFEYV